MKRFLSTFLLFLLLPFLVLAQEKGLVPCGNPGQPLCTFADFATLLNNVITFLMRDVLIPLATLSIAFCGFRYLIAFGNEAEAKKVHSMIKYTVGGILLSLAAYLLVKSALSVLVEVSFNPFN